MTLALASNDEIQVKLFDGHPVRIVPKNGDPWVIARDLATPLGITRQVVRTHVAELEAEDKDVYSVDTPGGKQNVAIISESGWLQITCQGRKDSAKRVRKGLADLAVAWRKGQLVPTAPAAPALPSPELAQLPARVDQLAARLSEEVEGLARQTSDTHMVVSQQACALSALQSRILRLETEKQATPRQKPRATYPIRDAVPDAEAANFFQKWRDWLGTHWREPNEVELMVHTHDLLPSLFAGTQLTVRGRQTRLGCWLGTRPEAERSRTSHRRYVRLTRADVIDLASRRSS